MNLGSFKRRIKRAIAAIKGKAPAPQTAEQAQKRKSLWYENGRAVWK